MATQSLAAKLQRSIEEYERARRTFLSNLTRLPVTIPATTIEDDADDDRETAERDYRSQYLDRGVR